MDIHEKFINSATLRSAKEIRGSNKEALKSMLKKLDKIENPPDDELAKEPSRRNRKQTRYIPKQIKIEKIKSSQGKCAYPSCNKPFDELHHRERFSEGGSHESVIPLCKVHHEFAHHRLIDNEKIEPKNWKLIPLAKVTKNSADEKFVKKRTEIMQ